MGCDWSIVAPPQGLGVTHWSLGSFNIKTFSWYRIPIINIRQLSQSLIITMRIIILVKQFLYIWTNGPKGSHFIPHFRSFEISLSWWKTTLHINGLVQDRCNSSALAMELHLSCTNSCIIYWDFSHVTWISNTIWAHCFTKITTI